MDLGRRGFVSHLPSPLYVSGHSSCGLTGKRCSSLSGKEFTSHSPGYYQGHRVGTINEALTYVEIFEAWQTCLPLSLFLLWALLSFSQAGALCLCSCQGDLACKTWACGREIGGGGWGCSDCVVPRKSGLLAAFPELSQLCNYVSKTLYVPLLGSLPRGVPVLLVALR